MRALTLALDPAFVAGFACESYDADRVDFLDHRIGADPVVLYIGLALKAELEAGCAAGRVYADSLKTALAAHLLARHAVFPPRAPRRSVGGLSRIQLRRVEDLVGDGLAGDLSLKELARAANLSPHRFARSFKAATGLTPHRYVLWRRVEEAKRLLASGRLSVEQVARRVGFVDRSHLARHFRRMLGIKPSDLFGNNGGIVPEDGKDLPHR